MTKEQAERWIADHRTFAVLSFKYPDQGQPAATVVPGEPHTFVRGREGYTVSGWAWPRDPRKEKERIHVIGESLEIAVEKAVERYDHITR